MGKRVEGTRKKKSIKANVTSKFSSKRKLSRMGKKLKKGKMGPNTEFITRSSALRRLQITLKDFRRLCILKGIYPRVPTKGQKGNDKVYYDIKDISYIMHEPLLHKFREFKAFMKKIRKAAGKNQFEEARRRNELKPKLSLDHLVKERYPRFIDALRDMDDALCMIHLFAALPSVGRITSEHTATCSKLAREWQYYVSKSKALRKVFVSVKGMYYQSEVLGEPITWLMPHAFTQALPREVDFRVMITFLEFYEVFVKFVLFKLYHSKGWQYPPVIDKKLDAEGCCLLSLKSEDVANSSTKAVQNRETQDALVESKSKKADDKDVQEIDLSMIKKSSKGNDEADDDSDDDFDISVPLQAAFSDLQNFSDEGNQADQEEEKRIFQQKAESVSNQDETNVQLFSKLVFFINREVPLGWLQLCITAFGGRIGWDGPLSPISVDDARITHHIIDRPIQGKTLLSREYIQPQWVFDCINAKILLPVRLYAPGTTLPPHLSPFVDDEKQGYMPRYREEIKKLQSQSKGAIEDGNTVNTESNDELEESDIDEEEENADKNKKDAKKPVSKKRKEVESEDEEDSDDREDEEEESEAEEVEDVDFSKSKKGPKGVVYQKIREATEEEEMKELTTSMMKKKSKRLYDRMQYGIGKKQDQITSLEEKRKALEEKNTNSNSGKGSGPKTKKAKLNN